MHTFWFFHRPTEELIRIYADCKEDASNWIDRNYPDGLWHYTEQPSDYLWAANFGSYWA